MKDPQVGDVVSLAISLIGLPVGTRGVCFSTYDVGDGPAGQFIFEGGWYDGFSPEERRCMLVDLRHHASLSRYQFHNAMQLSHDYRRGIFDDALRHD